MRDEYEESETEKQERPRFVYTTREIEPPKAPELEVELGGKTYLATCPNDYDFILIWRQMQDLQVNPYSINLREILTGFFDPIKASEIDGRCRGGRNADISYDELLAAMNWLIEQYMPYVDDRSKEANRATRRAKKAPARRTGGR